MYIKMIITIVSKLFSLTRKAGVRGAITEYRGVPTKLTLNPEFSSLDNQQSNKRVILLFLSEKTKGKHWA
jgi:hypothetical protein